MNKEQISELHKESYKKNLKLQMLNLKRKQEALSRKLKEVYSPKQSYVVLWNKDSSCFVKFISGGLMMVSRVEQASRFDSVEKAETCILSCGLVNIFPVFVFSEEENLG